MERKEIAELLDSTAERIRADRRGLLEDLPPAEYIAQLDAIAPYAGYHATSAAIDERCREIRARAGESGLEDYHRLVLLQLIAAFERRATPFRYPASVREVFQAQHRRIAAAIQAGRPGPYLFRNDSFCKDLGICTQRLIPVGAQLIERFSGVPRGWILRVGPRHAPRLARMIAALGGFRPLYQPHTDHRQLEEFNAAGWRVFLARTAALMRLDPAIRGMIGSTWFHDPEVAAISPRLRFIRELAESVGGEFFYLGESEEATRDAIENSPERYRRFMDGSYRPKIYAVIVPRRKMLAHAAEAGWRLE